MVTLALILALGAGQVISAEDARAPRVDLCTAQTGHLDRHRGFERPDGSIWWAPPLREAVPFDAAAEVTARQRPWFRAREALTIDGLTYEYHGVAQPDGLAFNRYHMPVAPVDGVHAVSPIGARNRIIWVLLDPVDCIFAEWRRDPTTD